MALVGIDRDLHLRRALYLPTKDGFVAVSDRFFKTAIEHATHFSAVLLSSDLVPNVQRIVITVAQSSRLVTIDSAVSLFAFFSSLA